jgi:thioredoxin reductase (NADPH)
MFSAAPVSLTIYLVPVLAIWSLYLFLKARKERRNLTIRSEAHQAGLTEPPSLHPVINRNRCMGCGSCINACPERNVLGIINDKSELINPTHCIGHGACKTACPQEAITLVFGTEKRGVDIPLLQPNFETHVPGIFIAGELGGMGLIRNAIEQGRQAMESIKKLDGIGQGEMLDVVIVGAGPSGISASLSAMQSKLRFTTVEQETLGGTVSHYPRGKIVMTAPVVMPIVGKVKFKETTKEDLLTFWEKVERETEVKIHYKERVETIEKTDQGFVVITTRNTYSTRAVLLTIGRRGTPRKLGVLGEELHKVVYRLIDPDQYSGQHVLVVGGGDSALEAAVSISEAEGTSTSISYRSEAFSRAKEKNRQKIKEAEASGRMRVLMKSNVTLIGEDFVEIQQGEETFRLQNDAVIICAGGILPTPFLKKIGITVETKYGAP